MCTCCPGNYTKEQNSSSNTTPSGNCTEQSQVSHNGLIFLHNPYSPVHIAQVSVQNNCRWTTTIFSGNRTDAWMHHAFGRHTAVRQTGVAVSADSWHAWAPPSDHWGTVQHRHWLLGLNTCKIHNAELIVMETASAVLWWARQCWHHHYPHLSSHLFQVSYEYPNPSTCALHSPLPTAFKQKIQ